MAIIKKRELKDMSKSDLEKKDAELSLEVARERGAISTSGKPNNAGRYREMRRTIARIKTLLREKK